MICRIQKSTNCSKGFTIIEVLLALAIFGTAATVLTFSFTNSIIALKRQQPNRHWESDLQFVRRLVLQAKDVDTLQEGDEVDTLSSGEISWEAEIEPTNLIDYYKVTVEYEIEDAPDGMESHTEVLYLLRPAWSEGEFAGDRQELLQDKQQKLNNHRQAMGILNNF